MVSSLRLPRRSYLPCELSDEFPYIRVSNNRKGGEIDSYIGLVGNPAKSTGDHSHVDERDPGMARGPAPVLVAIGVEFCRVC